MIAFDRSLPQLDSGGKFISDGYSAAYMFVGFTDFPPLSVISGNLCRWHMELVFVSGISRNFYTPWIFLRNSKIYVMH